MKLSPSDIAFLNDGHLWVVQDTLRPLPTYYIDATTTGRIVWFWFSHVPPCLCAYS